MAIDDCRDLSDLGVIISAEKIHRDGVGLVDEFT